MLKPRNAEPAATSMSPPTNAALTPRRATSSDPANAAIANNAGGMLERRPTSVALKANSSRIIAMTGGTARIVSRNALPASQSSTIAVHISCRAFWLLSGIAWVRGLAVTKGSSRRGKVISGRSFGQERRYQQRRDKQSGSRILVAEPAGFVRDVHGAQPPSAITDRHVHDRSDAEAENQQVIVERLAYFIRYACNEHFAPVQHRLAPRRSAFGLASAYRVRHEVAAVHALDLHRGFVHAHDRKKLVSHDCLHQRIDSVIKLLRLVLGSRQVRKHSKVGEGQCAGSVGHGENPGFGGERAPGRRGFLRRADLG